MNTVELPKTLHEAYSEAECVWPQSLKARRENSQSDPNALAWWILPADSEPGEAVEIDASAYYEALGVMPPIYGRGRFWISEALVHDTDDRPWSLECWEANDRFYCRISRIERRLA